MLGSATAHLGKVSKVPESAVLHSPITEGRIRAVLCLVYFGAGRDGRLKTSILGPYGVIWCHMVPVLPVLPLGPDAPWARPWPCGPGRGPVGPCTVDWSHPAILTLLNTPPAPTARRPLAQDWRSAPCSRSARCALRCTWDQSGVELRSNLTRPGHLLFRALTSRCATMMVVSSTTCSSFIQRL